MIKITDPSKCCGCTVCSSVCRHDAIQMKPDKLGFLYPEVDEAKCVDCGLCDKVCSFVQDVASVQPVSKDAEVEVLVARHKDVEVLAQSQSGGAFSAMAEQVLKERGLVYGAAFDDSHMVHHLRVDSLEGLAALRGSKYVQSDLRGKHKEVFGQIRGDLNIGFKVLFAGTPCQIAALKSYIPKNLQESLFTVDFICHGVPSPAIWKDYLDYMGRHGEIVKANFRDKSVAGWKEHKETFIYKDGKKMVADSFRVLFYKNIMLRHSCGVCPYNIMNHKSDVTIADFWGVDEIMPQMAGPEGTSMVVCNSEKGVELMKQASSDLMITPVSLGYNFMSRRNPNLIRPARIDKDRMAFEDTYARKGFLRVARSWGDLGLRYKLWQLKQYIRNIRRK